MVRTCIHSHILTAWIFFQPSCKPVVLNKYVLMFGLHHMGCIVTVWIAVGCFVVSACLKYSSEMVWTSIITRIPPAWLSSHLLQTNGIGQTSVYVWVGPTWVALSQLDTICILAGCLVVTACLKIKLWDGAHLHSFPYSNCVNFFQPSCKPVLLNKYVLMFGCTPHGLHCHSLNSGRLFRCICLLEV